MTAAGPWSVKGIDPKAREMAKDLARRSGMTLGEWLNQMIIDGGDGDIAPPPPFEEATRSFNQRQSAPFRSPDRTETRDPPRRRLLDDMYREATFAREAEAELRQDAASRRAPERGYRDPGPEFGWRAETVLPGRGEDTELARITRALETLSTRLETAEHRSTLAISGIDQSVMGVLSRLDGLDASQGQTVARLEGAIDQVRETQARVAERVRRIEHEDGSRVEALRALEGALSRLAGQINEGAARAEATAAQVHEDVESLGRRVNKVESSADAAAALLVGAGKTREELEAVHRRVEAVESAVAEAPDTYADADKVETVLARLAERLERAEARTTAAVQSLETSFAGLDARLRTNESRSRETDVVGEIDRRFQSLAADLSKKVDASRAEFAERLRDVADGAKPDIAKLGALESALHDLTGQIAQTERRSAQAIDRIGREVVAIAHSLGERVSGVETRSTAAVEQMGGEMARISDAIDSRLKRADTAQAEALEKLGGEIARIAERLTERIAASDKRSAETLDAAAGRFARLTESLSERQDQTASELASRIRHSEERTAKLLDDAREKLEQQVQDLQRRAMREAALRAAEAASPPSTYGGPPYSMAVAPPPYEPATAPPSEWGASPAADPFVSPLGRRAAVQGETAEDPFDAPRGGGPRGGGPPTTDRRNATGEPAPEQTLTRGAGLFGSLTDSESNPFDPDDDFQAPASGSSAFAPPSMPYEPAAPPMAAPAASESVAYEPPYEAPYEPPFETETPFEAGAPENAPFEQFAVRDFASSPELERPNSTREMLDQARAAAKRAAGGRDALKPNAIPAPPLEASEAKPFGMSFTGPKKGGGGSTLRTVGLASVWACAITSAAVGAYSLAVKDSGAKSHGQVADAPTAAGPPTEEGDAEPTKPQLAVALAPSPASSSSTPSAAAKAGPVSKTAAALGSNVAPSAAQAPPHPKTTAAVKPPAPAPAPAPAPTGGVEKASNPLDTARSLYDDSVHRIESGDSGAVSDLKRAANLGFAPAQFYLGRLYEAGAAGLTKDMGEARRWTLRAAQGGDSAAMYNLASYLYAGDGGPKDPAGAVDWFRKAAERGVVNGQYNLAQLYETGHGVAKNLPEAYKWYLVAAAAGDQEAKANVQTLKTQLAPDARASAERAATALRSQLDGPTHMAAMPGVSPPR